MLLMPFFLSRVGATIKDLEVLHGEVGIKASKIIPNSGKDKTKVKLLGTARVGKVSNKIIMFLFREMLHKIY